MGLGMNLTEAEYGEVIGVAQRHFALPHPQPAIIPISEKDFWLAGMHIELQAIEDGGRTYELAYVGAQDVVIWRRPEAYGPD